MSGRYSIGRDGGRHEPCRASGKTVMTQALIHSKTGNRGIELAAGIAQVGRNTIEKALMDEQTLTQKIDALAISNPERSKKIRVAGVVDKIADPMMVIPASGLAALCFFLNPVIGVVAVGLVPVVLLSASIWASRVKRREVPREDELRDARQKLAETQAARAELCARTGLSERLVELLQGLPLDVSQKHIVLRQAIFHNVPEEYAQRVAGILNGIAARGEDLKDFVRRRLEYLSRDISGARDLAEAGEKSALSGENAQACALFADAGRALEGVLDYSGAAEMYRKASDAILADGNKGRAAELSAKAGDCHLKAGEKAAARERYEWAAMIVRDSDPGLSSDYQGKAVALI